MTDLAKKFFVSHRTRRFLAMSTRCCSEASESERFVLKNSSETAASAV